MITGSLVALVTPMHSDGSVHWEHLDKLVDFHLDNGTHGIVAVGTTGESATLDPEEHMRVVGHIIKRVNGRIPVIAGTGGNSTREAIELTEEAHKLGADACLLVVPYYNKPTQEGLYQHFKTIAEAVPVDQILYNVPGRTACDMLNETVERLADIPNIIGIKDATGDLGRVSLQAAGLAGEQFVQISGDDPSALGYCAMGGKGCISVTANIAPEQMAKMHAAVQAGDLATAQAIEQAFIALHKALFVTPSPGPAQYALSRLGLCSGEVRLPIVAPHDAACEKIDAARDIAGLI